MLAFERNVHIVCNFVSFSLIPHGDVTNEDLGECTKEWEMAIPFKMSELLLHFDGKMTFLHQKVVFSSLPIKKMGTRKVIIIEKGFKLRVFKSYGTVTMS